MVTAAENKKLCEVGSGTPMGAVMRRYWMPFALSSDLPEPDCRPIRIRLFGENLVAFRNSDGQVGLLEEMCMHRGVSLALGRVEDNGIRCLYHGWKFGADGTIQETPNHCDARFKARMKAPAYKTHEAGGMLWAYLGPQDRVPPFRHFAFIDVPDSHRTIFRVVQRCNYLQLVEQGSDSSHVGILHSDNARPGWLEKTFTPSADTMNPAAFAVEDNAPAMELEDTEYGFQYVAFRQSDRVDGKFDETRERHARVYPFLMPTIRFIPAPKVLFTVFEVPMDDTTTATFFVIHGEQPVDRGHLKRLLGLNDPRYWSDEDNEFRANWSNGMGQDRDKMKVHWTGLPGVAFEDAVMGVAAGSIADRTREHLVAADVSVARVRKLLLGAADDVAAGHDARGANYADCTDLAAFDTLVAPGVDWRSLIPFGATARQQGEVANAASVD
ncbi:Rieske 2Fe-2S domain-containing protein [Sphingomonas tagetis]|nr:Rieske 2Fe-2S domain-containing protein [Sphingomonas tagetis]